MTSARITVGVPNRLHTALVAAAPAAEVLQRTKPDASRGQGDRYRPRNAQQRQQRSEQQRRNDEASDVAELARSPTPARPA